jgi:hypothetical protein
MTFSFKRPVTLNILFDLLDKICLLQEKNYVFDMTAYNKMKYLQLDEGFIQTLKEYYLPNNMHYLTKEINFKNFIIIVKQICKYHQLNVSLKNVCINGEYQNIYFIEHR